MLLVVVRSAVGSLQFSVFHVLVPENAGVRPSAVNDRALARSRERTKVALSRINNVVPATAHNVRNGDIGHRKQVALNKGGSLQMIQLIQARENINGLVIIIIIFVRRRRRLLI